MSSVWDTFLVGLAGFTLLGYVWMAVSLGVGNRKIPLLSQFLPELSGESWPKVSILIPARNEAAEIRRALTSVLALDYPDYEVIVLDDRSEDETGLILDAMAVEYPQLKVIHITELPPGWLGKNHALWKGANTATGELLLFSDADVVFEPTTLRRAVACLSARGWDHMAMLPVIEASGFALNGFIGAFTIFFAFYSRYWEAQDPKKKSYIGIGAFNLIRASVYQKIGTHQAIALRPDDDMKLGKLVKHQGFRQGLVNGVDFLSVAWYPSLGAMVEGLMKNAFAGVDYRLSMIVLAVVATLVFHVWPAVAMGIGSGPAGLLNTLVVMVMVMMCRDNARFGKAPEWIGFVFPLSALLMVYVLITATYRTLTQNGIYWRGTFYPLEALRANRV